MPASMVARLVRTAVSALSILYAAASLPATAANAIPWEQDTTRAFATARDARRPLLIQFLGNCGRTALPGELDPGTTNPRGGARSRPAHSEFVNDCDRMEQDVWSHRDVVGEVERFLPLLTGRTADLTLHRRYEVVRIPTVIVTDPWGNEVIRLVGYTARDRMQRVLRAMPSDFTGLEKAATRLAEDGRDFPALLAAAQFYEQHSLPEIVDRYYERALSTELARADATAGRRATIGRGLNLMRMRRPADAVRLFQGAFDAAPAAAGSDVLLIGLVTAHLQANQRKEAEAAYKRLAELFPASPYTAQARQNLEGGSGK